MCVLVDDGAQRGRRVQRVAGCHLGGALHQLGEELPRDRRVQQEPGIRRAHRALVVERAEDRLVHRGVQVGVGEHQIRALAAAFQPHLLGVGVGGVAQEPLSGLTGTGERDDVDVGVAAQCLTGGVPEAGHHVEHPFGHAGLGGQFGQPHRRKRCLLSGFEHHAVAGRQRGCDLPDRQVQREVPRRDGADDAQRLPGHQREAAGFGGGDLAVDLVERLAVEREKFGGRGHVDGVRLGDELAHVHRIQQRQFVAVLGDEFGQPLQHALAMGGRGRATTPRSRTRRAPKRTAASTSSASAEDTRVINSPVAGLTESNVAPDAAVRNLPSMKISVRGRISRASRVQSSSVVMCAPRCGPVRPA